MHVKFCAEVKYEYLTTRGFEISFYDKLQSDIWALGFFKVTHAKFVLL